MVCVETANAAADVVSLAPGGSHTLEQVVRVASLTGHEE
jgi:D-hexose-6-phosphate mutarotase